MRYLNQYKRRALLSMGTVLIEEFYRMRRLLTFVLFGTVLVSCLAEPSCQAGLNERQNWYQCGELTDLRLQIPPEAEAINIVKSNITKIPADAFSSFANSLTQLNITGCNVEEIEPNAFRGLDKLEVLGLVGNKIRKIDASWIRGLSNLRSLILWDNQIIDIDPEIYDLLPNLQVWDIAHNRLTSCLSPDMLKKLTKLRRIWIAANPWSYRCRASMTWYLGSNHIRFVTDWQASDLLIEECLAHELGADTDDTILHKCVDRKAHIVPYDVVDLRQKVRELTIKLMELESEVAMLKKLNQ